MQTSDSIVIIPTFNDKDVKTMFQSKNGTDDLFYILPFIVGGDDDNAV